MIQHSAESSIHLENLFKYKTFIIIFTIKIKALSLSLLYIYIFFKKLGKMSKLLLSLHPQNEHIQWLQAFPTGGHC